MSRFIELLEAQTEALNQKGFKAINREPRVVAYVVEAENFESIHNHSAFARIVRTGPAAGIAQLGTEGESAISVLSR